MAKSALYRLKASLKEAGAIGPNSRASLSKKERKKGRPTAASAKNDLNKKLESIREAMNPFEIKVTKQKYDILGRKTKGVEGKPTLSKQVGEENRRKTLLQELQKKKKAGGVVDRRFGEDNPNLTPEEKMLERFTKEKQSRAKGGAMFNLEEESDLTHYGQSLAGLDDFDESGLGYEDDDDDGNKGAIGSDIVSRVHFGGFGDDEEEKDEEGRPKSKAEIMKEVIAKSKYHKHERQKEKEETEDMRKELDDELDDIRGLLGFSNEAAEERRPKRAPLPSQHAAATRALDRLADEEKERMKAERESGALDKGFDDDYDKFVRELAYDRRAKPQDRMKTEEEIAQEEAEKLEKAERARKRRMEGLAPEEEEEKGGYRNKRRKGAAPSADDLEDDFALEDDETFGLGTGMVKLDDSFQGAKAGRMPSKRDAKRAQRHAEEEEDEGDADEDEEGEEDDEEDREDEEEGEDDEDDEGDDSDDYSDLDIEEDGFVAGESDDDMNDMSSSAKKTKPRNATAESTKRSLTSGSTKSDDAVAAAAELPYTFPCPTSLNDFLNIINDIALKDVPTVVHRIRALHHPKLSPQNKQKMEVFYPVLLDYVLQISGHKEYPTTVLNALTRHLYAMTSQLGDHATSCILSFLEAFEGEFQTQLASGHHSGMPGSDKLTFLRILGQIYSTSDFQHQVITPAQLLMSQYLGQCQINSGRDLASGLMLCNLFLDYQQLSKRVIPEAINFLDASLVYLAPKGTFTDVETVPGNFPLVDIQKTALQLSSAPGEIEPKPLNFGHVFNGSPKNLDTDQFRCSALSATVDILVKYAILYGSTSAFKELFEGSIGVLKALTSSKPGHWNAKLSKQLVQALDRLEKLSTFATEGRTPLQLQAHKPVPIASYVPKFEEGYSMDKHYDPDTERAQLAKLQSQVRKEKKGAMRELRKDAAFIAREKMRVQREKDATYKAKIKGIMSGLEAEQGEKNTEERMKQLKKMKSKRG